MTVAQYALLGWPVKHSVSPPMQEAAFRNAGIAASYELISTPPEELGQAVCRLVRDGFAGWNITVPHKEAIGQFLDEIDEGAALTGSVNTVVNRDGHLTGYSTDGYGLTTALHEHFALAVPGSRIVFIGSGGAARACAIYLASQGAASIVLTNRTLARAQAVIRAIKQAIPACRAIALPLGEHTDIEREIAQADMVIQSTSLGLKPGDALPLPASLLSSKPDVLDMIYSNTPFLQAAAAQGCRTADGRSMLLHQGARSFELWTGQPAPVEIMRQALNKALDARLQTPSQSS